MEPAQQRRDVTQAAASAPPKEPKGTGVVGWFGKKILGMVAVHEAPQSLAGRKIAPQLIDDIATKVTQAIILKYESEFLAGGQDHIKGLLSDLFGQVVQTLSTQGIDDPSKKSDEELMEQFFVNIVAIFKEEFETEATTEVHFKNIANTLLDIAFPKKVDDPHLPKALQQLLKGKGFYHWVLKVKVDTDSLTWEKLVDQFAQNLCTIHDSMSYPKQELLTEKDSPGIGAFLKKILPEQKAEAVDLKIDTFNDQSNALINTFIKRVLVNTNPTVDEARKWLRAYFTQNTHILLSVLFNPKERIERVDKLASHAVDKLQALKPETKEVELFLQTLMKQGFDKKKLEKLFPAALEVDDAFKQLSGLLAPFVLQVITQIEAVRKKAPEGEVAPWVATGLVQLRGVIEAKAKAGTLALSGFPFLDECICHLLMPGKNKDAKDLLDSLLKSLAQIVLKAAKKGEETDSETLARIVNLVLEEGRLAVVTKTDVKEASKKILATVISEEAFTNLLPDFLKMSKLWESVADLLVDYLKGMKEQIHKGGRVLEVDALKALLKEGMGKITKLVKNEAELKATTLDRIKGKILQGKPLQQLVEKLLPPLLESILAYHVNPKDGKSSEKRAAELFFTIVSITDAGFEKIEKAENNEEWLLANGYTKEDIAAYRKAHDVPPDEPITVQEFLLRDITSKLVALLLPEELYKEIVPPEFLPLHLDQLVSTLLYGYVKQAQEFSHIMRSFAQTTLAVRPDLDVSKIQTLLGAKGTQEAFWLKNVLQEIFETKDPKQKAQFDKIISGMLVAAFGMILSKSEGTAVGKDLVKIFGPIAKAGQKAFLLLNQNKSEKQLGISTQEIARYKAVIGKNAYDKKQLTYWVLARRGLDALLNDEEWQKLVPEFLMSVLSKDMVANLFCPVYERVHEVQAPLQREAESGSALIEREERLKKYVDETIVSAINDAFIELGKKDTPLSDALPPLIDAFIKQGLASTGDIGDIRNILVERLVYSVFSGQLKDKKLILNKLVSLYGTFQKGDHAATAKQLVATLLPKELLDLPLSTLLIEQMVLPEVTKDLAQLQGALTQLEKRGTSAHAYLKGIEGVGPLVDSMLKSLDETLDEMALDPSKMTKELPNFIDGELKAILGNKELAPIVKKVLHSLIQVSLQEACTPKEKALEVMGKLIELYNQPSSHQTATEWLKLLMPEKTLQELLPEFLRPVFTHEKLAKWFFVPYVEEVKETEKRVREMKVPEEAPRATKFVKELLVGQADSKGGILSFGGAVRELERGILSKFSGTTDSYLEAVVSQVLNALRDSGRLDIGFLSAGLVHALSSQEQVPDDFSKKAAKELLAIMFPGGAASLLVPEVAKKAIWGKVEKGLEEVFTEMTKAPVFWTIKRLISLSTDDQALRDKRLEEVATGNQETLFKDYFVKAAVHQAELQVQKSKMWGPFNWFARQFVKVITYFVARFSLRDRFYNFISSPDAGEKIARIIWSLLKYKLPAGKRVEAPELSQSFSQAFKREGLLPGVLLNPISSKAASTLAGKNIVEVLA